MCVGVLAPGGMHLSSLSSLSSRTKSISFVLCARALEPVAREETLGGIIQTVLASAISKLVNALVLNLFCSVQLQA